MKRMVRMRAYAGSKTLKSAKASARVCKLAVACACAAVTMLCVAGCSSTNANPDIADTSEGVAATVDGASVGEKIVSTYVADFRAASSLEDDDAWGEWLVARGYTPSIVRDDVLGFYIDQVLCQRAADEYDVRVDDADVDKAMAEAKAQFDSEEAWQKSLEAAHTTENKYRESVIRQNVVREKLAQAVVTEEVMSDDEVLEAVQDMAGSLDGMRRSSHILFGADEADKAQEVLDALNDGTLDFADAVRENSVDTASVERDGDVGWDGLNNFVPQYREALAELEPGETSELVYSDYGIHIIMCTDSYEVSDEGIESLDDVPAEVPEHVRAQRGGADASREFSLWFDEYKANAHIEINDMPAGLPYDIDVEQYKE